MNMLFIVRQCKVTFHSRQACALPLDHDMPLSYEIRTHFNHLKKTLLNHWLNGKLLLFTISIWKRWTDKTLLQFQNRAFVTQDPWEYCSIKKKQFQAMGQINCLICLFSNRNLYLVGTLKFVKTTLEQNLCAQIHRSWLSITLFNS